MPPELILLGKNVDDVSRLVDVVHEYGEAVGDQPARHLEEFIVVRTTADRRPVLGGLPRSVEDPTE